MLAQRRNEGKICVHVAYLIERWVDRREELQEMLICGTWRISRPLILSQLPEMLLKIVVQCQRAIRHVHKVVVLREIDSAARATSKFATVRMSSSDLLASSGICLPPQCAGATTARQRRKGEKGRPAYLWRPELVQRTTARISLSWSVVVILLGKSLIFPMLGSASSVAHSCRWPRQYCKQEKSACRMSSYSMSQIVWGLT